MPANGLNDVVQRLRRSIGRTQSAECSDSELLERFVKTRDEAAFRALMDRHGAMVLGVCRRVLGNRADAEDAFQATFLVLVRKAGAIVPRSLVGNWLYGVAYKAALKALAMNRTRRVKEREALARKDRAPAASTERLHELLDAELAALPDVFRTPIVLCDLEGRTIKEAAERLGWPAGTVASRLARGRRRLAARLTRLGHAVPAAGLAAVLSETAAASVPAALQTSTMHAALAAAGATAGPGVASAKAALLTEQIMKALLLDKLKGVAAGMTVLAGLCLSAGLLLSSAQGQGPEAQGPMPQAAAQSPGPKPGDSTPADAQPAKGAALKPDTRKLIETMDWALTEIDAARSMVGVSDHFGPFPAGPEAVGLTGRDLPRVALITTRQGDTAAAGLVLRGLRVGSRAKITLDGKPAQLRDLHPGFRSKLRLDDGGAVAGIEAVSPRPGVFSYVLKAMDAKRGTITASLAEKQLELKDIAVDPDATIQELRFERTMWLTKRTLADLEVGMLLALEVTAGKDGAFTVTKILGTRQLKR